MKTLHPHRKRSILGRIRRASRRFLSTASTGIIVPNTSLITSDDVGRDVRSGVPNSLQRRAWLHAQQHKSRAVHLKRIQRIDW